MSPEDPQSSGTKRPLSTYTRGYNEGYSKGYNDALSAASGQMNTVRPDTQRDVDEPPKPTKRITIDDLSFSTRTRNALLREGINTLFDLLTFTEANLLCIRDFGTLSLKEVRTKVEKHGYTMRP